MQERQSVRNNALVESLGYWHRKLSEDLNNLKSYSHIRDLMTEEVLKLKGKAVDAFLAYDSRKLSEKERDENKKAHEYYLKHCKKP